jgi:hypothetical protein
MERRDLFKQNALTADCCRLHQTFSRRHIAESELQIPTACRFPSATDATRPASKERVE